MQANSNNNFTQINQETKMVDCFFSPSLVSFKTKNHLNLLKNDRKKQFTNLSRIGVRI